MDPATDPDDARDQASDRATSVEIVWHGDVATEVMVAPHWAEHETPQQLLDAVRDLVNDHYGASSQSDWRFKLSLENVALEDLAEFNAQLADARAEAAAQRRGPEVCSTLHFRAVWHGGSLLELTGDDEWAKLPLPVMGRDLAEAIAKPETPAGTTVARDRLLKFIKKEG